MTYDYPEEENDEYDENSFMGKITSIDKKKLLIILVVLILLIGGGLVATGIISPGELFPNKDDISFTDEDGVKLSVRGSTTSEGDVETFNTDGTNLNLSMNPEETARVSIQTRGIPKGLGVGSVTVIGQNGTIISTTTGNATYDANGQLIIIIDPNADLGLTGDPSDYEGDEYEYIFQVVLVDANTGEEVIFEIPAIIGFAEFVGTGCIVLNRSSVSETTHYGELLLEAKLRVLCSNSDDLLASVDWSSNTMGPVEVLFDKSYSAGTSLVDDYQLIESSPQTGEYKIKIFFVPSNDYAGDRAKFDVDFKLGNAIQTIKFDVAVENLEQCVSVTSDDPIITHDGDEANILIDAKNCKSSKINFYLCDGDYGCGGGTDEGEISLDNGYFALKGGKSKSVKVTRGEIAGVYGVTVHASIPGMEKTFIDEKEITVLPTAEYVYPEKFVVSLLEVGTKDSVRIRNNLLAEDVGVDASICDLYSSSIGESDGQSWLYKMYGNYDYYAGEGLYIAGFTQSIGELDAAMFSAKSLSYAENVLIKDAYTNTEDVMDDATDLLEDSALSLGAAEDLQDEIDGLVSQGDASMASDIISLVTTTTGLVATAQTLTTEIGTTQSTLSGVTCSLATADTKAAISSLKKAATGSSQWYRNLGQILISANDLYSLWTQIESLTAENQTIEAETAVENAEDAHEQIQILKDESEDAFDYMESALEAAAIDALTSASDDDLDAKQYIELAKTKMDAIKDASDAAELYQLAAYDGITTALADEEDTTELTIQAVSLILTLIGSWTDSLTTASTIQSNLSAAQASLTKASTGATQGISNKEAACVTSLTLITTAQGEVSSMQGLSGGAIGTMTTWAGRLNSLYQLFELYETMTSDLGDLLTEASSQFSTLTTNIQNMRTLAYLTDIDIDNAIEAAQQLVTYETQSSDAATYLFDNLVGGDFKEKRRMQGLVGSIISTGFVDGAKYGGVYSTSDTLFAADCENRVTMTLPDFQINLLKDASSPTVYNNDIIAQWDFSEPMVYDFFDEQEVALKFSDNGLKENSYAIVELPVKKHSHSPTTLVNGSFGPFNIPDSKAEDLTYKYHFKFNMEERKSANPTRSAICEKGILFGETGEDAGAQMLLSWDWNAINSTTIKDKYIDATQLSILIAKKLSVIDNFLKRISISCPNNYAFDIAKGVVPTDIELTESGDCYLPLSTKYYEGKPSLYHQLDYVVDVSSYPAGYDAFFDEPIISDAEQFLEVVDFNVNLMLDGFGTNFQDDFSNEYTTTLLKSNPGFTDPNIGGYKYFDNDNIFFYSSKAKSYYKDSDFVVPDAGKYRVRLLIEFDGASPQLFSAGATKAKVVVDLELIESINNDFSPLYYTPFDGSTGLKINNNRKDYGSALSSGSSFDIVKKEGILLTTDQKDALAKLKNTKLQSFTWLNSLASRRAKILDYSYSVTNDANIIFSPTTATPMLMKINGVLGTIPYLAYEVNKDKDKIAANSNSLFLWTGIDGCRDFYGGNLNQLINNTPDYKADDVYGMFFSNPNDPGAIYLKTIAYTPTENAYGLGYAGDGEIITTNYLIPTDGVIQLDGISGMPYNDLPNNAKISSLLDIFNAVDDGAVCVSQLGGREIYWWPEDYLFEKDNANGENMLDREIAAKGECIR
jgi:hypothetical protein